MIKSIFRGVASAATAAIAPTYWRISTKCEILVLMYHRVLPSDSHESLHEQAGMFVSPETLDMHARVLRNHFELVHLDDWLEKVNSGRAVPRLACALTFDDGWRDNFVHAFPVLKANKVPSTIFLVSQFVDNPREFWPNTVARLLGAVAQDRDDVRLPEKLRQAIASPLSAIQLHRVADSRSIDQAINILKKFDERQLEDILGEFYMSSGPARDVMNRAEVREMSESGLIRFGSHGATHRRFRSDVNSRDLEVEVVGSKKQLGEICGREVRLFCYPNGDTTSEGVALVRDHYLGAVTTQRGWHSPNRDQFLIRRIGVHDDVSRTETSFLARISGWL